MQQNADKPLSEPLEGQEEEQGVMEGEGEEDARQVHKSLHLRRPLGVFNKNDSNKKNKTNKERKIQDEQNSPS